VSTRELADVSVMVMPAKSQVATASAPAFVRMRSNHVVMR
jgi:hypothetical protein